MYILDDQEAEDAEKERLRRKLQAKKKLSPEEEAIQQQQAIVREKNKYWAPILLLYPLGPVCVALTTVVFGGVITNAASTTCNAHLNTFLQGAVGLSYILILFYAYCWIGPRPIRRLKVLKVFYGAYGFVCFLWWGVFGTMEAVAATATGFDSCLSQSPMLYVFSQYQIAIFWLLLSFFLCFAGKEMHEHYKSTDEGRKAAAAAKRAQEEAAAKEAAAKAAAREAAEKLEAETQAELRRAQEERDKLYANMGEDEDDNDASPAVDQADEEEEEEEAEAGDDEDEAGDDGDDEGADDDDGNNAEVDDDATPEHAAEGEKSTD
ncbi:hypothetical protein ACHHYP_12311 [Achlya hypogyna]|uniref:Uncharacterized protein n=1 Tax=Achlya hypogyna TaxID=1202772 RepID=A0A1V9ZGY8_ACHHY|nr:hypothetical protein ACHHYP_12311 [Achlya hypogyna]